MKIDLARGSALRMREFDNGRLCVKLIISVEIGTPQGDLFSPGSLEAVSAEKRAVRECKFHVNTKRSKGARQDRLRPQARVDPHP
ncbi:hypothetical protein [Xanthomonas vesicatoria]|uniref:Uncharacterized protein n=1 Tax=Xanthomonas vesicatoria TaxID=56460 RepID=A0ABS8L8Q6_9XANT|nr:hypothetical protein [Xanthomonas vesicatoria]MCC8621575.1 hypothetical protein [Xanthomonas vesicatoria]MCC8693129.1 hypothetical protein [Xanthomonas vesicatoria]MCC8702206.1 hypothetical protein [Xanthomonas vesicatoria]MDG4490793.1 hypothetical protein [Xanthomonas vesicatoria]